ncbi:MAG: chemotaxis protein CheB [Phycisphaerales bacterium]
MPEDADTPPNPASTGSPSEVAHAFPVVAVGASAGGLEAFTSLLKALPIDTGMAFVLIPHLSPSHPSAFSEILSRATRMPVTEVADEPRIEPNHVYVIPPGRNMVMRDGHLQLLRRDKPGPQHSVNIFFRSLAEVNGERAIGVVLSGTANDGTLGLEEIKAAGGITFAQDESAQQGSMPKNAVASGCVDFVLPPDQIAHELARIAKHPYVARPLSIDLAAPNADANSPLISAALERIFRLLRESTGVDFSSYKSSTLNRRIDRRVLLHKLDDLKEYADLLERDPAEVDSLYRDILISVTSFFRDPAMFEQLKIAVFPKLIQGRGSRDPLRVWVLGCSTGEEAYSIAMAFAEFEEGCSTRHTIQIFASDLNEAGIQKARSGVYSRSSVADVSPERLRRFFVEINGEYRVNKQLREMCVFARQNVLVDPPFSKLELISCRNLLIYLDSLLQRKIIPIFHYALKPGGFLILGNSETVGSDRDLFELVDAKNKIYGKSPNSRPASPTIHQAHALSEAVSAARPRTVGSMLGGVEALKESDRLLLARFVPPSVVVSAEMEVLQFRGDTSPYFTPASGKASLNVFKMVRQDVVATLRAVIQDARQTQSPARAQIRVSQRQNGSGDYRDVELEVLPVTGAEARGAFLVLFHGLSPSSDSMQGFPARRAGVFPTLWRRFFDRTVPPASGEPAQAAGNEQSHRAEITRLTQELSASRTYAQSLVEQHDASTEELQSASEEAQSSNEELQSINEELETSKEEIQSSNEELSTVNDELHHRNQELSRSNNDLTNLFASVQLPIIIVGRDLCIRRFNQGAEKLLNVIPSDVGRPVADVRLNIDVNLEPLLQEVMDTLSVRELEVKDRKGRWYLLRLRPYRTLENTIDGVVVVLVDVDALRRAREYAESIIANMREPLVVLDRELRVQMVNQSFLNTFKIQARDTVGQLLYDLGNRQWNIPELKKLLENILPQNAAFDDYTVEHNFETIGQRTMLVSARVFTPPGMDAASILLSIDDITARRSAERAVYQIEHKYRTLVEQVRDYAIIGIDPQGRAMTWNEGVRRVLGFTQEEFVGRDVKSMIFTPEDVDAGVPEREFQAAADHGSASDDRWMKRKDGSRFFANGVTSAIRNDQNELTGFTKVLRDQTDQRALEEQLRLRDSELSAADRSKNDFIAVLSHELRNPLNAIAGWVRILQDPGAAEDPERLREGIEVISRNAKLQSKLIGDLLDVHRMASGKARLELAPADLRRVIHGSVEAATPAAEEKQIHIEMDLDSEALVVSGDTNRLHQVLGNLLTNAIKFTQKGGRIRLELRREEMDAVIRLIDNGEGISPETLPFIFDRFRQAEQSSSRTHGGLGLGLAIAKQLVELHGGTIEARSAGKGKGAVFVLTFPLSTAADVPARPSVLTDQSNTTTPVRLGGMMVVIVDDDPDAREPLRRILEEAGAEVVAVASAEEAVEVVRQQKPDVLVSDIAMPHRDGYDLLKSIRALPPGRGGRTPAIALTAFAAPEDRRRVLEAGFASHLVKPVEPHDLISAISSVISPAPEDSSGEN